MVWELTNPLYIQFINDLINNTLTVTFETSTIGQVECVYNTAFDTFYSGNDYIMLTATDAGTIYFDQFDIDTSCQEFPVVPPSCVNLYLI